VHSGFAFHASPGDLNRPQTALPRIPYEKAYGIFLEAVRELARYGARKGVKLALENNVVAEFNLSGGRNEILLLAEAEESLSFFKEAGSGNLFFLIDLGHLKVTSNVLKFDKDEYLKSIIPYVIGFHLDDNNGLVDEHRGFDESVWFRQILMENREKTFILEAQNLSRQGLKRNYLALESMLVKG
jgi:sugar phosphate isomerase/epimerase